MSNEQAKQYLNFSAMKLMYDSLTLSHLQFGITNLGFELQNGPFELWQTAGIIDILNLLWKSYVW